MCVAHERSIPATALAVQYALSSGDVLGHTLGISIASLLQKHGVSSPALDGLAACLPAECAAAVRAQVGGIYL